MNEFSKTIAHLILTVATLLLTAFFWESSVLLAVLLAVTTVAMLFVENHRAAFVVYFVGFLLGPLSESLLIYFGAWTYADPHILGFPLWLPFLWGNAALFINRLNISTRFLMDK